MVSRSGNEFHPIGIQVLVVGPELETSTDVF